MNYAEISKDTMDYLYQSRDSLKSSPVSAEIQVLAELRVSQINGCSYCCHLHTQEARKIGVSQEKLDVLPAWKSAKVFTEEEEIILEWVECVTHLDDQKAQIRAKLSEIYSEKQIVDLTVCISIMNALNRIVLSLKS